MAYNSTIITKKKHLACGCYDFNFSKGRCKMHAAMEGKPLKKVSDKRMAELKEPQEEQGSFNSLIQDIDTVFSKYIRLLHSDKDGNVICFTSGVKMRWQDSQCGHYISRKHLATRWLPENCRVQSEYDNCHLSGNLAVFKAKLDKEKNGITEWLEEQARQVYKPTVSDLKEILFDFRERLKLVSIKVK